MDTKSQPATATAPIRRSRLLYLLGAACLCFIGYQAWIGLPQVLTNHNLPALSRANIVPLLQSQSQAKPVTEIYGFLHMVTHPEGEQGHSFKAMDEVNWRQPVSMDTYAVDNIDWKREMNRIDNEAPVIVFSKTYCPFSKRAKALLAKYNLTPEVKVVEVDLRDDAGEIKQLLTRLTHHSTFPNVLIRGESIGGADNLARLHNEDLLQKLLQDAGVKVGVIDY